MKYETEEEAYERIKKVPKSLMFWSILGVCFLILGFILLFLAPFLEEISILHATCFFVIHHIIGGASGLDYRMSLATTRHATLVKKLDAIIELLQKNKN